jgi:chorismate dehydratase
MKISAVAFLNSAPLWWGLKAGMHPAGWQIDFDAPSACAQKLASGGADVGLIPSVEFARNPDLVLAAPLCVAARREVTSVLLLCGGELSQIRKVWLDPASRTSQALTRVLLDMERVPSPEFEERPHLPRRLGPHEAALVIGDRALRLPPALAPSRRVDLAELWHRHTGLPFVFAVWAASEGSASHELASTLEASFAYGQAHLPQIEKAFTYSLDLPEGRVHTYLTRHLHYSLDKEEFSAMALFFGLVLKEEFPHDRFRLPARVPRCGPGS